MSTESLRTVKDRFSEFVDRVEHHHERVVVTKNGHPAAVLVSPEDLESLEETLAILSDPGAMEGIRQAEAEIAQGDYTEGIEAVRALRAQR
jgi:antitoxin YefM